MFIVGLEENIFPSPMSCNSQRELEEERRLLYVAITRAEKNCVLTCARNRYRYGKMEFDTPSRFIKDIAPSLLQVSDFTNDSSQGSMQRQSYGGYGSGRPEWGRGGYGSRYQNSKPVASQFMADPKPREASHIDDTYHFRKGDYKEVLGIGRPSSGAASRTVPASGSPSRVVPTSAPMQSVSSTGGISVGSVVEHSRFGMGTVLRLEGSGENSKATVEFKNVGVKQLLMKFARLKVIK